MWKPLVEIPGYVMLKYLEQGHLIICRQLQICFEVGVDYVNGIESTKR